VSTDEHGSDGGPSTEQIELQTDELDAIEMVLEERIEDERFGAVPTNESAGLSKVQEKIRDQRGGV